MKLTFAPRGILQIDDARLIWRNFAGKASTYNREGDKNFALVIPDPEIAEALQNDLNKFGVGWNVKAKPPREEGEAPLMYLPVKVKFNERGPRVFLVSGENRRQLDEVTIACLDSIDIAHCDLDIRPYDDEGTYGPFRAAYLHAMEVVQDVDRFSARYAEEEYPEE